MTEWKPHSKDHNGDDVYDVHAQDATHVIELTKGDWLVVKEGELIVEFALFTFVMSDIDGSNAVHSMLMHGSGPSGNLRECRHTWWGDGERDGYIYYVPFDTIELAFKELRKWFDGK